MLAYTGCCFICSSVSLDCYSERKVTAYKASSAKHGEQDRLSFQEMYGQNVAATGRIQKAITHAKTPLPVSVTNFLTDPPLVFSIEINKREPNIQCLVFFFAPSTLRCILFIYHMQIGYYYASTCMADK